MPSPRVLVLGGTTEASALAADLAARGVDAIFSYAGRVARPKPQPLPTRTGGFGGAGGLARWLGEHRISHVVDATHPFAAQISHNAIAACAATDTPLIALTRPEWVPRTGDSWTHVPDIAGAVAALAGPPRRVMLAIGRMHLADFATQPQHFYLLRLIEQPERPPFPDCEAVIARGPFSREDDAALLRNHRIDLLVTKNAGGAATRGKLDAARELGIGVLMIARPDLPDRAEAVGVAQVLAWLDHVGTERGV
jgi:precorrin-6A/cobalt-precorrin-6A reductase